MTKKRMAWLEPCFSTVAVRPWYVPFSPGGRQERRLTCTQAQWGLGEAAHRSARQKEEGPSILAEVPEEEGPVAHLVPAQSP